MQEEWDKVGDGGGIGFEDDGCVVGEGRWWWWRRLRGVQGEVQGVGQVEVIAGEGDAWWSWWGGGCFGIGFGGVGDVELGCGGVDDVEMGFVLFLVWLWCEFSMPTFSFLLY